MGEGLWLPPHPDASWFAFIEPESIYGDYDLKAQAYACQDDSGDDEVLRWRYREMKRDVLALLPRSYHEPHGRRWLGRTACRDDCIWAENHLAWLLSYEDSYNRVHLGLVPRFDDERPHLDPLARRHVAVVGPRFLDAVHARFPLSVRSSAWTSRPYVPTTDRTAAA